MKQISWLSACRPPAGGAAARTSRTSSFGRSPTGKTATQLRLRQREEKVGLILAFVHAAPEHHAPARVALDAGVVAGRHRIAPKRRPARRAS